MAIAIEKSFTVEAPVDAVGKIVFERLDLETRTAEISGRGQDVRGRGGADMKMMSRLTETDGGTAVNVVSEVNVTGILAQFGQGMIQSVSDQLFQTFTEKMKAELTAADTAADPSDHGRAPVGGTDADGDDDALDVVSLGAKVGSRAVGRTLRRPRFWLGVAVGLVLYFLIF